MSLLGWLRELGREGRVVARRGHVVVREVEGELELWLERRGRRALQGRVERDRLMSGIPYTDGFQLFPPPPGGAALFVGAGAGIGPRQLVAFRDARVDVVDSDEAVLALAAEHFGLVPGPRLAIHHADGRAFLERGGAWDLIVIDAFGAGDYPTRLATAEAFALCRERLREPGTLVVNLAGTYAAGSRLPSVVAGLVAAFGADRVRAFGVPRPHLRAGYDPRARGNTLAFAFRGPPPAPAPDAGARLPHLAAIAACPVDLVAAAPLHDGKGPAALPIR